MRITVIGANGRAGREVVHAALERGHAVTATVRAAAKTAALGPDAGRVRVALAEAGDVAALTSALTDADAVAFCLGPVKGESPTVLAEGMIACLGAMELSGCKRLVAISVSGRVGLPGDDPLTRYIAKPIVQRVLRETFADVAVMEERIDILEDTSTAGRDITVG